MKVNSPMRENLTSTNENDHIGHSALATHCVQMREECVLVRVYLRSERRRLTFLSLRLEIFSLIATG